MTDEEYRYDGEIDWETEILSADLAALRKPHGNRPEPPEFTPFSDLRRKAVARPPIVRLGVKGPTPSFGYSRSS